MTQVVGEGDWTEITDFSDFNRIARARAEEIGISREWIDHLAGVTDRYAAKNFSLPNRGSISADTAFSECSRKRSGFASLW